MGFACAVVAHDQQTLIVHGMVELKLGNDKVHQPFGHLPRDDVGLNKMLRG